jgi:hypothetical protein
MDEEELLKLIAANPGTQLSDLEALTTAGRFGSPESSG